ncbi:MAG: DUF6291 domain-containing protein [Acutalibacteraceae bacterium]
MVYFDWEAPLTELSDEELGELFRAMFKYARNKEEFEFEHRSLKLVFGFVKSALDRDRLAYEERCKKNAENAAKAAKNRAKKGAEMGYESLMDSLTTS